mgnify:CR=1 FL=1
MRAVICGDVHIGAVFGLGGPNKSGGNTRVDDYASTLNWIVDYTINSKAEIFIQTGDLFEVRNPTLEHMAIADAALKRLSRANVASFVIMGNHDYKRTGTGYTSSILSLSSAELPNVKILVDPKIIHFTSQKNESANLLLIPYRDRRLFSGKTNAEQSESLNKQIKSMIAQVKNKDPIIAIGHNFFYEGSYQEYGGSEVMLDPAAFVGCDIVMMGHLHQARQVLNTHMTCLYTGSMEKTNFGDINVSKSFIDYNFSDKLHKIITTPVRDLLDFTVDLTDSDFSNIIANLDQEIANKDLKEKIVRAKILCEDKFLPALDKHSIQDKIYSHGSHFVSKVIIEASIKRIVRDNSILMQSDDFSMLKAFIESQGLDQEFKAEILQEAKSIILGVS